MRKGLALGAILICVATAQAQPPDIPAFDVASFKPSQHIRAADGTSLSDIRMVSPGNLQAINASLQECLVWAYRLKEFQVSGPAWINSAEASYDIEAKAPPGTPEQQVRMMLRTLLAQRLNLKVHTETRQLPV